MKLNTYKALKANILKNLKPKKFKGLSFYQRSVITAV